MLLSYNELVDLVDRGVITNVAPGAVNASSIDVRLGKDFKVEMEPMKVSERMVDLFERQSVQYKDVHALHDSPLDLHPGQFILAATMEEFHLPDDISAQFLLKSSMARNGLNHLAATWCDAGWQGSVLTLELRNDLQHHILRLRPGMFVGQMKFYRHTPVPEDQLYSRRGRYNGDRTVQTIKH